MKRYILLFISLVIVSSVAFAQQSNRKERRAIINGNELYHKGDFSGARKEYQEALKYNPSSPQAIYNLGLSQIRMGENSAKDDENGQKLLQEGTKNLQSVSQSAGANFPELASKAIYNLGNLAFNQEDYASAINNYKQALRYNPDNDEARRNLRIAQLRQQNQDQNKDDKKDNKEDNKDRNQDQNKDQNQDQNNNQNQDQNKDNQQKQPPQNDNMSNSTADQILNAVENKENATRARLLNQGNKSGNPSRSVGRKNW